MTASPDSADELVLVIDAGGTKTVAWLARLRGPVGFRVVGRGRAVGGNPLSAGWDVASRVLAAAVDEAHREAKLPPAPVERAVLSIAGAADSEVAAQIVRWARDRQLAQRLAVVSDVLPVLAAGTDDCCGIALVAGTGSVAFGRTANGRTTRTGGWGYLLGDDGSGYAIGRAGLRHALENIDRRDPLTHTLLSNLNARSTADVTSIIYRGADPRTAIAAVASLVIRAAEGGDSAAKEILDSAGDDLAQLVACTGHALGWTQSVIPLALAGGVLVGSADLRERIEARLQSRGLQCRARLVAEPLEGCLRLADPAFSGLDVEWH